MRQLTLVLTALTALATLPDSGSAQSPPQPGERIRILTMDGTSVTGTLALVNAEGMILSGSGPGNSVRAADIAFVERSVGRYRRFARNVALTTGASSLAG